MKEDLNNLLFKKSESFTKPSAGKTMLGLLRRDGLVLHEAHSILIADLKLNQVIKSEDWSSKTLLFRFFENSRTIISDKKHSLVGSSLILNWICGRILNQIPVQADLLDAEMWFHKSSKNDCDSINISQEATQLVLNLLRKMDNKTILEELPYLAEVFETGNETAIEKGATRLKKKNNGIYYTPTDIIDFIVTRSLSNRKNHNSSLGKFKWYDPALGTGSFLLSVLKRYIDIANHSKTETLIHYFKNNLFGTDISPQALQTATYLIATNCLIKERNGNLKDFAIIIGSNLVLIDATTINNKSKLAQIFPEIGSNGVDFIISNPPYSKKQKNQLTLFTEESDIKVNSGDDLYPDFIKILTDLTCNSYGGGAMIVPISLVTSSKANFKHLRNYIQNKNGSVEFWNFDRTPDSLFGDDVKTRNTIFFYTNEETLLNRGVIKSTYLHRWNSRNRDNLFDSIGIVNLGPDIDITNGVPKVGDKLGLEMLKSIYSQRLGYLSEIIKKTEIRSHLTTKNTAYNWLPVELCLNEEPHNSSSTVNWMVTSDVASAPMVYAILNSRITYWFWRLWSDGFHLTDQFIYSLPFGIEFIRKLDKQTIEELGLTLWNYTKNELIVSKNAGIISYSYCPLKNYDLLDKIDDLLIETYGLPNTTLNYLKNYINQLIIAGREKETRTIAKMKFMEILN